jgi:hypothetical protein
MKPKIGVLGGIGLLAVCSLATAAPTERAQQTALGLPAYPGWTVHRLDDKADGSGKIHVYQYQYFSNDPAQKIVQFYEQRIGATASFMEATSTYTVNAPDGAMVQIMAPPDGVPQTDDEGASTGKTWASLITIIRFQTQ